MSVKRLTQLLTILLSSMATWSQQPVAVDDYCRYATDPTVSLLTCAPGSDIYELEGHSGLRLKWNGHDMVAHWGLFDFNSPNFVYRFVKGETDYSIGMTETYQFLLQYKIEGRQVTEQVLNLTPEQAEKVIDAVLENMRPENRIYRYNYVKDNCATRPLTIIEKAIGEKIGITCTNPIPTTVVTFRNVMRYYHRNYPWYQLGIDLALGSGIDYVISTRETAFAPHALQIIAASATITDSLGRTTPLVKDIGILTDGNINGNQLPRTPWYLTPIAATILLLALTAAITWHDIRKQKISKAFDVILFSILGIIGCIISFLVFISSHEATSPNYLLLWINPICLIVPIMIWSKCGRKILSYYQILNIAAIAAFASIWVYDIQSGNIAFIPLMISDTIRALTHIYITRHVTSKNA